MYTVHWIKCLHMQLKLACAVCFHRATRVRFHGACLQVAYRLSIDTRNRLITCVKMSSCVALSSALYAVYLQPCVFFSIEEFIFSSSLFIFFSVKCSLVFLTSNWFSIFISFIGIESSHLIWNRPNTLTSDRFKLYYYFEGKKHLEKKIFNDFP